MQEWKYHGQGVLSFADGGRWEGEWQNNTFNGHGGGRIEAMQAKYPQLKECAALVKLGLTAADTVRCSCACLLSFLKLL